MYILTLVFLFIVRLRFPAGTSICQIIKKRYGDHVLKTYRKLQQFSFKEQKAVLDKIFLCECKKNNLIPNFLRIKLGTKNKSNIGLYNNFQKDLLDNEIKVKSKSIAGYNKQVKELKRELKDHSSYIDFCHFNNVLENLNTKKLKAVKVVHERKLFNLGLIKVEELNPNKVVYNYSRISLSQRLVYLLSKGLKFSIPRPKLKFSQFLLPFEKLLRHLSKHVSVNHPKSTNFAKSVIKSLALSTFYSYRPDAFDAVSKSDIKLLKELSKRDDIIVCKPDKGQGVVILNKDDYENKITDILSDNSKFVEVNNSGEKLIIKNEDQLNNFLRKLKKSKVIGDDTYNYLFTTGSRPGVLYGLPKIHKPNVPLRPILSAIGTINYKISKFFIPLLKHLTINEFSLNDTFSFVNKVSSITDPNKYYMASFDVTSLFTNVPLEETIDIIINTLFSDNDYIQGLDSVNFRKLLNFATKDILFYFGGKIYKQIEGVAMGSPLGPTLANIFMCHFEKIWLRDCPSAFKPSYYFRYVDDTFLLFKSEQHVKLFLEYLNAQHKNIKFTFEVETNNTLPFLDVNVTRDNNEFVTSVYRKPTYTGLTTKFDSYTPSIYKQNLVSILIYRAFKISRNYLVFHNELKFITDILCKNGFPLHYVQRIIRNFLNKIFENNNKIVVCTVPRDVIFVKLPFLGSLSYGIKRKLSNLINKNYTAVEVRFIFTTFNIGNYFNFKDKIPQTLRSMIVYKYECGGCNATYIGKTSRNLFMRIHEHRGYSFRSQNFKLTSPMNSPIRDHCEKTNHNFCINNFKVIDSSNNNIDLNIIESLNIWSERPSLNDYSCSTELEIVG